MNGLQLKTLGLAMFVPHVKCVTGVLYHGGAGIAEPFAPRETSGTSKALLRSAGAVLARQSSSECSNKHVQNGPKQPGKNP